MMLTKESEGAAFLHGDGEINAVLDRAKEEGIIEKGTELDVTFWDEF